MAQPWRCHAAVSPTSPRPGCLLSGVSSGRSRLGHGACLPIRKDTSKDLARRLRASIPRLAGGLEETRPLFAPPPRIAQRPPSLGHLPPLARPCWPRAPPPSLAWPALPVSPFSRRARLVVVRAGEAVTAAETAEEPSELGPQAAPVPPLPTSNGSPVTPFPAWARDTVAVAAHYGVDLTNGLTEEQVATARAVYGWNELEKAPGKSFWKLVLEQFDDALVQILLAAAAVSAGLAVWDAKEKGGDVGLGDFTEPLVILLIVVLNAVIGVWQESKAESTLEALKEMQSETARVRRAGREIPDLPARELVPGDVVELRVGDKSPADVRLVALRSATLRVQQASLTGESQPVLKQTSAVEAEDCELQAKENMVFSSSAISNGTAFGVVVATGMTTEIGKIQSQIQAASEEEYATPLTRKLDEFADLLTKVVGLVCLLVWVINYKYFISWDVVDGALANVRFDFEQCAYYFKVAVALAVAAIPEGLPAVITTCLALGTRRMAQENAIVRRLPSVETLGCTSVICSDKTGTLTTNQMSAVRLITAGDAPGDVLEMEVLGTTYNPTDGAIVWDAAGGLDSERLRAAGTGLGNVQLSDPRTDDDKNMLQGADQDPGARGRPVNPGAPIDPGLPVGSGSSLDHNLAASKARPANSLTSADGPVSVSGPLSADGPLSASGPVSFEGTGSANGPMAAPAGLPAGPGEGVMGPSEVGGGLCLGGRRNLVALGEVCAVCNDAGVVYKAGKYGATGMPTEAALKVLAEKIGVPDAAQMASITACRERDPQQCSLGVCDSWTAGTKRLATLEFDRLRKSMSVLCMPREGEVAAGQSNRLLVKGAAECVLQRSSSIMLTNGQIVPLTPSIRAGLTAAADRLASRALRCLALAERSDLRAPLADYDGTATHPGHALLADQAAYEEIESGLVFLGLAGLQDPPRSEVRSSIRDCDHAGIRVVVITGDNKSTAEAICQDIGLFGSGRQAIAERSITGSDFMRLPSEERARRLLGALSSGEGFVFSRAEPAHKQEIVKLLQQAGEVVAMTGDGVNDGPALKSADIGVAMGIAGTEVAKEASDMVLADDNFATIVIAVREGRAIYANMKSFIRYLISSNIGEVVSIFLTAALGLPQGLLPVQLLWVNLVTDGAPATALGFTPPEDGIMDQPPRSAEEGLVSRWLLVRYCVIGLYVGLATVLAFGLWYTASGPILGIDLTADGHTPVTWHQLMHWGECKAWDGFAPTAFTAGPYTISFTDPCDYFTLGKVKASTLSMSTLVAIEMFNAFNALSENNSLFRTPPWVNRWLLLAIGTSVGLHVLILYVPFLQDAFDVVPLSTSEWAFVVLLSLPILGVEEVLKWMGRRWFARPARHTISPAKQLTASSSKEVS